VREALAAVNYVERVQDRPADSDSGQVCSFIVFSNGRAEEVRSGVASCVVQHGWGLLEIKAVALSLEDLFMRLVTEKDSPSGRPAAGPRG
jgi:hypothetical protein